MATVTVDENLCIGCGLCADVCPDVFEIGDDGQAHAVHPEKCGSLPCCAEAAEQCPVEAIKLEHDTLVLRVKGMTCDHCRAAVERALRKVPGVSSASVDLSAATATVVFEPGRVDRDAAAKAIEEEGYTVSP